MSHVFRLLLATGVGLYGWEAAKAADLPEALSHLTGCFHVTFKYLEQSEKARPVYQVETYEWIKHLPQKEGIHLQHYAVVQRGEKTHTFVHWGEQWKEGKNGIWQQTVFLNERGTRYSCKGQMHSQKIKANDGKETFVGQRVCKATGCPKPTRHRDRKDYDKLDRVSTLHITAKLFRDVQQNTLRDKDGKVVTTEVGWNEYRRVDKKHCEAARKEYGE